DYRAQLTQIEGVSAYTFANGNLTGDGPPERIAMGCGTSSLFPLLGVNPVQGRRFTTDEDQEGHEQVALLTHGFWRRRFGGDPRAVGRSLRIDGLPYVIVGVLPPEFDLNRAVDLWTPLSFDAAMRSEERRSGHSLKVLARIKPGASAAQAQADLDVVGARLR